MKFLITTLLLISIIFSNSFAEVRNPVAFIGQYVMASVPGAPLSADSNGQLISGIPFGSVYVDGNITCGTTDAVITGMTIAAPPAGTYKISMAGDSSSANAGVVVTVHFRLNAGTPTGGNIKFSPFAGGTLTSGSQRVSFAKEIIVTLDGTNPLELWCSTSANTVTMANSSLTFVRLL